MPADALAAASVGPAARPSRRRPGRARLRLAGRGGASWPCAPTCSLEAREPRVRRRGLPPRRRAARRRPCGAGPARPGRGRRGGARDRPGRAPAPRSRRASGGSASPGRTGPCACGSRRSPDRSSSRRGSPGDAAAESGSGRRPLVGADADEGEGDRTVLLGGRRGQRGAGRRARPGGRSCSASISGIVAASGTGSTGATTDPTPRLSSAAAVPSSSSPGSHLELGGVARRAGSACRAPTGGARARRP